MQFLKIYPQVIKCLQIQENDNISSVPYSLVSYFEDNITKLTCMW